jgi:hypothetical protein
MKLNTSKTFTNDSRKKNYKSKEQKLKLKYQ